MVKAVIYKSNTGHTQQYASMLSEKLNIPFYTIEEAKTKLKNNDEIIFLGWIFATKIQGLNKVKCYNVKCVGAVGANPKQDEYINDLKKSNNLGDNLFYLRGGIDFSKLKGLKKVIINQVGKMMTNDNKSEDQEIIKLFNEGANYISEDNLKEMLEFLDKE